MTTQIELTKEFFQNNPNRNIAHPEAVDWLTAEYKRRTGKVFRDPDRFIRQLHQQRFLQKIKKGVYRYDPDMADNKQFDDFTKAQKEEIKKRDAYKCVICGLGIKEGLEIHVDHIKPRDKGGLSTIENGQVLCAQHNFKKKNYNQTETAKKLFINLHRQAKAIDDEKHQKFAADILKIYEKHNINGHIEWPDDKS